MHKIPFLILGASLALCVKAVTYWSGYGLVGRDGKPWNGTVNLYMAEETVIGKDSLVTSVQARNGQFSANTSGGGEIIAFKPMYFYYTIVDGDDTFTSRKGFTSTSWSSDLERASRPYPDILTISFADMGSMNAYRSWVVYSTWAAGNGVSGEWSESDDNGVRNIFRYMFNIPGGKIPNSPIVNIGFQDNEVLVITPEVVNSSGVTANVIESSDVAGENITAAKSIGRGGTFNFGAKSDAPRYYRISAEIE